MAHAQRLDLLPASLFSAEQETTIGSVTWGSYVAPQTEGIGRAWCVGRNSDILATLDIEEMLKPGRLDVMIETAAIRESRRWRPLGGFADVKSAGVKTVALHGAASWVRARWKLASGIFSASLSGDATVALFDNGGEQVKASGTWAAIDLRQYRSLRLTLAVSSIAGGALSVTVETAPSKSAPASAWRTVALFPAVSAPSSLDLPAVDLDRFVRVRWALPLGASAVFTVAGMALLVLATPSDRRRLGIRKGTFPDMDDVQADAYLVAATSDVLGPFYQRYEEPLLEWSDDVAETCIAGADWKAIKGRGTDPAKRLSPDETTYYEAFCRAFGTIQEPGGWVALVGREKAHPRHVIDSAEPDLTGEPSTLEISSEPLRGWRRTRRRATL